MLLAHELVDPLGRVEQVTGDLRPIDGVGQERERHRRVVAALRVRSARNRCCRRSKPRRRAGLQPAPLEAEALQRLGELVRRRLAGAPGRPLLRPMWTRPLRNVPVVTTSAGSVKRSPFSSSRPMTRPPSTRMRPAFPKIQSMFGLALERALHPVAVAPLVRLRARRPDRRSAAPVQQLELDAGGVDGAPHQAAERVDLADQMPLRRAADRRIARHVRDGAADSVQIATRRPSRAAAHAASTPAWPAPMTITSNASDVKLSATDNYFPMQNRRRSRAARRRACRAPVISSSRAARLVQVGEHELLRRARARPPPRARRARRAALRQQIDVAQVRHRGRIAQPLVPRERRVSVERSASKPGARLRRHRQTSRRAGTRRRPTPARDPTCSRPRAAAVPSVDREQRAIVRRRAAASDRAPRR